MEYLSTFAQTPLVVTTFILLVPLIPAACVYLLLTSKAEKELRDPQIGTAAGDIKTSFGPAVFGMKFNVVGSAAFYIVVLVLALVIFVTLDIQRQRALADNTPWLVELPLGVIKRDPENPTKIKSGTIDMETQNQLQLVTQPSYRISGESITFWVLAENEKFPRVTISLPNVSSTPPLDLNDITKVKPDFTRHHLTGLGRQWIQLQAPYDPSNAATPKLIGAKTQ